MWKASAHKYYQILSHDIKKQKYTTYIFVQLVYNFV